MDSKGKSFLSYNEHKKILDKYELDNIEISKRYFNGEKDLFQAPLKIESYENSLTEREKNLIELFAKICVNLSDMYLFEKNAMTTYLGH